MVTQRLGPSLGNAIVNQDDPATVRDGAPAYLLMVDGLIADRPDDRGLLISAAQLYSSYAMVFVEDPARAQVMTAKARGYARRAFCAEQPRLCELDGGPQPPFAAGLQNVTSSRLPALYAYATSWAAWIKARGGEPLALADVPKVEAMLARVVELDESYARGEAQLYLGILRSQIPPALGGRPEIGQRHFEKAIAISEGRNLFAKLEYARHYARLVFDRALHDRLLNEVLAADPTAPGYTLGNVLAQQQARILLEGSADYFEE